MMLSSYVVFLLLCLVRGLGAPGGTVFTEKQTAQLQDFLHTVMRCKEMLGLSIAVVKGNQTWTGGYGISDRSSERPVTGSSLFGLGSITKAFTVSLLSMLLKETPDWSWDVPLLAILGDDFRLGDDYMTADVTLEDLLTHRTGLMDAGLFFAAGFPDNMTTALYEKRVRYLPTAGPFRDSFAYNDWMYILAGRVAEVLGGEAWEQLLRWRLLQPVGMVNTDIFSSPWVRQSHHLATPHIQVGETLIPFDSSLYMDASPVQLQGGLVSSAEDMSLWMHVLLHQGATPDGTGVLLEESLKDMWTARVLVPDEDGIFMHRPQFPVSCSSIGYGLGWFTAEYRGYPFVHHPGRFPGYTSVLALFHDVDLGIFITTNASGYKHTVQAIFYYLADILMGLGPWLSAEDACRFPQPWSNITRVRPSSRASEIPIISHNGWENEHAYLGCYGNKLLGDFIVSEDTDDGMLMTFNKLQGRLYRTTNESVLLATALGTRHFLSLGANETRFMILRFGSVDGGGVYQELFFSFPEYPEVWSFQRNVRFHGFPPK